MTNTLAWFEIATVDADAAERFYGDLFGWTFRPDSTSASLGLDYRITTAPGTDTPMGGIVATGGTMPDHAVFSIVVADVATACTAAEELGGSVVSKEVSPSAGPAYAYLRDPAGNLFGVFSPPA